MSELHELEQWLRSFAKGHDSSIVEMRLNQAADVVSQLLDAQEASQIADDEYRQLKWMVEQGVSIDGEFVPLIVEGGLVDRSVGIDEPNFLTIPDEYDTDDVREAFHRARNRDTGANNAR